MAVATAALRDYAGCRSGGNPVGLIANYNHRRPFHPVGKAFLVHILAIKEGSVNIAAHLQGAPAQGGDIRIMELDAEDGTHGSLDYLGIEDIYGIRRCEYAVCTEPVCNTEDGAQIPGVADAVQRQEKTGRGQNGRLQVCRARHDGQRRRRGGEAAHAGHGGLANLRAAIHFLHLETGVQRLLDQFFTFYYKYAVLVTEFLL